MQTPLKYYYMDEIRAYIRRFQSATPHRAFDVSVSWSCENCVQMSERPDVWGKPS